MLLAIEAITLRAHAVGPDELSAPPAAPAFAALEDRAAIDLIHLVELYPLDPPVI
jgi:hypothetical protein